MTPASRSMSSFVESASTTSIPEHMARSTRSRLRSITRNGTLRPLELDGGGTSHAAEATHEEIVFERIDHLLGTPPAEQV